MGDDNKTIPNNPPKPITPPSTPVERPQRPTPDVIKEIPRQPDNYGEIGNDIIEITTNYR